MASQVLRTLSSKSAGNIGRCLNLNVSIRHSSFRSSQPIDEVPLSQQPRVHIDRSAALWQHVANILPAPIVPTPTAKAAYTSGWQPATASAAQLAQLPYFVRRTKNHMVPVYLERTHRGQRRVTELRLCSGDIWLLEHELKELIERRVARAIVTRVNEMSGQIWFKGDYVTLVRDYLVSKGL